LVVHRETGWLCDEVTPAALAEGLWYFLGDSGRLRAASKAARESLPSFGLERFEDAWARVFELPRPEEPGTAAARVPVLTEGSIRNGHSL
jgi:hypothetical protein